MTKNRLLTGDLLKAIPTTRYQGSKRKILPWLYECMKGYEFHSVLDAFGELHAEENGEAGDV